IPVRYYEKLFLFGRLKRRKKFRSHVGRLGVGPQLGWVAVIGGCSCWDSLASLYRGGCRQESAAAWLCLVSVGPVGLALWAMFSGFRSAGCLEGLGRFCLWALNLVEVRGGRAYASLSWLVHAEGCFCIMYDSAGSTGVVFGPTLVFLLLWLVRDWLSLLSLVREAHPPTLFRSMGGGTAFGVPGGGLGGWVITVVASFPAGSECDLQESVVVVAGSACYKRVVNSGEVLPEFFSVGSDGGLFRACFYRFLCYLRVEDLLALLLQFCLLQFFSLSGHVGVPVGRLLALLVEVFPKAASCVVPWTMCLAVVLARATCSVFSVREHRLSVVWLACASIALFGSLEVDVLSSASAVVSIPVRFVDVLGFLALPTSDLCVSLPDHEDDLGGIEWCRWTLSCMLWVVVVTTGKLWVTCQVVAVSQGRVLVAVWTAVALRLLTRRPAPLLLEGQRLKALVAFLFPSFLSFFLFLSSPTWESPLPSFSSIGAWWWRRRLTVERRSGVVRGGGGRAIVRAHYSVWTTPGCSIPAVCLPTDVVTAVHVVTSEEASPSFPSNRDPIATDIVLKWLLGVSRGDTWLSLSDLVEVGVLGLVS
ncbi:hypothetical protein Taro_022436, partial [Colocasia esculenta]|nr:hypothetical protein [Colocasia esculenta]